MENIILQGVVGSTAHGTGLDGQEDRDEMGIFVEPAERVCGIYPLDHHIERTQPEGVRSCPGDLDLTLYSLRKYCRLAVKGNPSVQLLLWLSNYMVCDVLGQELVNIRKSFISRDLGNSYLGYLISQKKGLTGERGKKVQRPELVEKFGYDTKFAMHALRLGLQGIELLTERHLSVPTREPDKSTLLAVRRGEVPFTDVLQLIEETEQKLREVVDKETAEVDVERMNEWLSVAHHYQWGKN